MKKIHSQEKFCDWDDIVLSDSLESPIIQTETQKIRVLLGRLHHDVIGKEFFFELSLTQTDYLFLTS
ncbi:uncharacterized protein METZ01_LOCUS471781 [marine metagenome]|uniref:Uncharacterized protein n=1 Tax=marine metagenome TaxID=408172 RepID=A0A383BFM9_9ZZZZ